MRDHLPHKAQNRIQDPAKLRCLLSLMDGETWLEIDAEVQGRYLRGIKAIRRGLDLF